MGNIPSSWNYIDLLQQSNTIERPWTFERARFESTAFHGAGLLYGIALSFESQNFQ